MKIYLVICMLTIVSLSDSEKNKFKLTCVDAGECMSCSPYELKEDYCKKTGKKIQILCKGYGTEEDDFRSCDVTANDEQFRVLLFQAIMALIGGLAYWGVQSRKPQHMTRFDYRKQRRGKDENMNSNTSSMIV